MNTGEKLAADTGDRIFYFYIVQKKENELSITMYSTPYTFIRDETGWRNASSNYFSMADHLINAVVKTAYA